MRPDKYQLAWMRVLAWGALSLRLVSFVRLKEMRLDPAWMLVETKSWMNIFVGRQMRST
jgi:hypothetical protein